MPVSYALQCPASVSAGPTINRSVSRRSSDQLSIHHRRAIANNTASTSIRSTKAPLHTASEHTKHLTIMGLAQRLREEVEHKRSQRFAHLESVESVHDHIRAHTERGQCLPASIEMCVLSTEAFPRGWRCTLTDKDAAQDDFASIKTDFDKLTYREQGKYVFRLTIWRGKIHPHRQPHTSPGSILFVREVNDLKTYNSVCQGTAEIDDFIKEEDEDMEKKGAEEPRPPAKRGKAK